MERRIAPRSHAVIAGTGRAGTSFLVRFLDACGLEIGIDSSEWFSRARAGLEHRLQAGDGLPYVVKDPWLFGYCEQLDLNEIAIDALIVPMRDLMDAATSRVYQERLQLLEANGDARDSSAQVVGSTPGGILYSLDAIDQARILAAGFHKLLHWAVRNDLPVFLLDFPRLVEDRDYLLSTLEPWLGEHCSTATARDAFAKTADRSAIRVGRQMISPTATMLLGPGEPDPDALDRGAAIARLQEAQEEREALVRRAESMADELRDRDEQDRKRDRDAASMRNQLAARDRDLDRQRAVIVDLQHQRGSLESELAEVRRLALRTDESVTWQTFQRARGRLYTAIGEKSPLARVLSASLRVVGRGLLTPARDANAGRETITIPESSNPKVSLIIPLRAHADLTAMCLRSICRCTDDVDYEVILVDDDADAATKQRLRNVAGAKLVRNEQNIGYLRSIARGASMARGQWFVLFNNDTEVTPGWLSAMLACAESAEDIGIVTPKYIYPDGTLNEAGGIIWRDGTGVNYGRGDMPTRPQYEHRRETDYGSGAALMVSASLWQDIGGFDERFLPMYYEDADLCFEAREHGARVMYEPEAIVIHIEGATAGTDEKSGPKRYQQQNRPKFVEKWRHRLDAEHLPPAPASIRAAANRLRGPHVLLVDYRVPTWDRDAGSLRMLGVVRALLSLGARVTLLPDNPAPLEPYTRALRKMGVEVLSSPFDAHSELPSVCSDLDTAILCRPTIASRWLDSIREFAASATVAYDTVDLHWLREARRLAVSDSFVTSCDRHAQDLNPETLAPKVKALRELELAMVRATDVTLVVTDAERRQIELQAPGSSVIVLPTVHDVAHRVLPADTRSGILFIGGFAHTPNVDAAIKLVREVMPTVWRELGDVPLVIAGGDVPPEIGSLASSRVEVAGWVEDLQPLLEQSRLMLAPITYGAGIKGKVTQCLAAGLPVVTTAIGAEGIDPSCLLVEADASALAAAAVRLYRDDRLWSQLSQAGQEFIVSQCSPECVAERLAALLGIATSRDVPAVEPATIS